MRLTTLLLISAILQVSASTYAQKISLSEKNATLSAVFDKISDQSGYDFVFTTSILKSSKPVNINVQNKEFEEVLKEIFNNQPLSFSIKKKTVVISLKEPSFLDKVVDVFTPPINISGLVLDEKGLPLPGVTVRVKGSGKATSTGNDGRFYLTGVDDDAVIEIRMVGYKVLEIPVKGKFEGLRMEPVSKELEEVVVAYGKTTQQALTGAVTVIKGDQIADLPNRSFDKSLQGLVPGLLVTNGTGQPGGGVSNILMRGISTGGEAFYGQTTRNPLVVIDGVPVSNDSFQIQTGGASTSVTNPMAQINPHDIESISVLKDASAIALYGSKASNGVIMITTKKGKSGKSMLSVSHQTDISWKPGSNLKMLNQQQYLELLFETYKNTDPVKWTDAAIRKDLYAKFPYRVSGSDTSFYATPDWERELFEKQAASYVNNISFSGATDKLNYYLNLEYTKQDGIVKKTGYDRKSIRVNLSSNPFRWLKIGANTTLSYNVENMSNSKEDPISFGAVDIISPLNPILLENGDYVNNYSWGMSKSSGLVANPALIQKYNKDRATAFRGLTSVFAELKLFKSFTLSSTLGADFMLAENKIKEDPRLRSFDVSANGLIMDQTKRRGNIINTNILRFNQIINNHHSIDALIGQEAQILTEKSMYIQAVGTVNTLPYYEEVSSPGYTTSSLTAITSKRTLLSQFTQLNYGFLNKYFLSGSYRRDGSSLFGEDERWGSYWSAGGGWIVSSESFFYKLMDQVNYLKLRGSFGVAGNSAALFDQTRYDILDESLYLNKPTLVIKSSPGNPDIKWEETFNWNIGLETRLLNDRIAITADFYRKKTKNMIYTFVLPTYTGYTDTKTNIGDMHNDGIELVLSGDVVRSANFKWKLDANWSRNSNKLIKTNGEVPNPVVGNIANEVGREFNSFYMPVWMGVNADNGKPQWMDADGKETDVYSKAAKQFVGKAQPDGFGSLTNTFNWKPWQASFRLYYQYGFQIHNMNLVSLMNDGVLAYTNQSVEALDRWQKPGDIAKNPIRKIGNTDRGNSPSTRQLFDGDYIKLQNVTLSYRPPQKILQHLRASSLRVFIQGNNLAVWSKQKYADPDNANLSGAISNSYPNARSVSIGILINFN